MTFQTHTHTHSFTCSCVSSRSGGGDGSSHTAKLRTNFNLPLDWRRVTMVTKTSFSMQFIIMFRIYSKQKERISCRQTSKQLKNKQTTQSQNNGKKNASRAEQNWRQCGKISGGGAQVLQTSGISAHAGKKSAKHSIPSKHIYYSLLTPAGAFIPTMHCQTLSLLFLARHTKCRQTKHNQRVKKINKYKMQGEVMLRSQRTLDRLILCADWPSCG